MVASDFSRSKSKPLRPSTTAMRLSSTSRFFISLMTRSRTWPLRSAPARAASERFESNLERGLKRGVFRSVTDLQAAINRFLDEQNDVSKPFTWTDDPAKIIAAVRRGHQALDSIHKGYFGYFGSPAPGPGRRGRSSG